MRVVDTHCHIGLHKYEPVESLTFQMETVGVDQAVFIQYGGNSDNGYIVECLERFPGKFAAAMIVEETDDGTRMRKWSEQGIGGIRLPANSRAATADPLAQWRTAQALDLVVSAPCTPKVLLGPEFQEVLNVLPDLQIVIEHLAGVTTETKPPYDDFKEVMKLADRANLTIKLPGFGEFCKVPLPFESIPPFAEMAIEAFGPERVMWGSDYPPVSSREGYRNSLEVPKEYLSQYSQSDRESIFGGTAKRVWKL